MAARSSLELMPHSPDTLRPRRSQAERSAGTRMRLVAAAIDALNRLGYSATSTVLVADLARVSRGAMLHQFSTKALLMAAVIEASYADHLEAYRAATNGEQDAAIQLQIVAEVAWDRFRAPSGIAQTEIWMATRSDPELAAVVLPIHDAIFEQSKQAQHRRFIACGLDDRALSDGILIHNVALLRGLALEFVLGTPELALRPAIDYMKRQLAAVVATADARKDTR